MFQKRAALFLMFQSAPANYGGRIAFCWPPWPLAPACFNPRPPITAGESRRPGQGREAAKRFNPRPPITAGESGSLRNRRRSGSFQSAPANYGGRIRYTPKTAPRCSPSFNPRPPITAGESEVIARQVLIVFAVSIRARQLRRANLTLPAMGRVFLGVSIRARQLRRANPTAAGSPSARIPFQSAPANYGGRIGHMVDDSSRGCGFNPRPPITAGESLSTSDGTPPVLSGFNPRPPITAGESPGHSSTRA